MLKAIIIDREENAINQLCGMLTQYCGTSLNIGAHYRSFEEAMPQLKKHRPHLIFIDAQLHIQITQEQNPPSFSNEHLVICSSSTQLAYHAFQHNAMDFLLKPYNTHCIQRVAQKIKQQKESTSISKKFDYLLGNVEQLKQYTTPKKIIVPTVNGFELLPVIDILRCQSEINYTTIFLKDKQKLVVAKTLKEFEDMLGDYNFFRVHNSHLVNLSYIKSYQKGKGGSVVLTDGTAIEVSSRRKDEFLGKMSLM
ncbi:MAG: LytTR family DNA-binding domain-containing protein [Niabella sp.]